MLNYLVYATIQFGLYDDILFMHMNYLVYVLIKIVYCIIKQYILFELITFILLYVFLVAP
jgi:hypothetical protein